MGRLGGQTLLGGARRACGHFGFAGYSHLAGDPLLALGAYFYAVLSALSPSWFYRGLERMREAAVLEVAARGVALLGIVLLVRSPEDAPLVLFIHGGAAAFASLWGLARLYRELGFVKPSPRKVWASLGMGFSIFPFHAVNTLGLVINPIVLGLFAPPAAVGVFAAAERLARSFWAMLDPLNRAFLPRLAHLAARDPRQAGIFAAKVLVSQGVAGALAAVSVAVVAPWLVHLFFGAGYEEAAGLLRVMAFILLGGALANALGVQWAFAIGQDKLVNRVTFFAMLFQLCLAFSSLRDLAPWGWRGVWLSPAWLRLVALPWGCGGKGGSLELGQRIAGLTLCPLLLQVQPLWMRGAGRGLIMSKWGKDVSFVLPALHGGGVERVFLELSRGMAQRGLSVELVVAGGDGVLTNQVDGRVTLVDLGVPRACGFCVLTFPCPPTLPEPVLVG